MKLHAPYDPFRYGKAWHGPVLLAFFAAWFAASWMYGKVTDLRRK